MMQRPSVIGVAIIGALALGLFCAQETMAQTANSHAVYTVDTPPPSLQQTMGSYLSGTPLEYDAGMSYGEVGYADGIACDSDCCATTLNGMPCDGCDSLGCDGCGRRGRGHRRGGAFCLMGGHDMPYDFCFDTLGASEESCFDIGGWVQAGYTSRSTGQFNSNPHRLNNHQSWIYMEKTADGQLGLDWGFRMDAMYGTDADDTQAFGNPPGQWDYLNGFDHGINGFAMPQLYFEMAYQELSIKVGHFFTLLGYEVVPAPDNFFFSHSFTMYNSEAFTHTGALATYQVDEDVTLYGGWTEGWDTGFDRFDNGSNFLGGFSLQLTESSTFTYITTLGDLGKIGDGYSHSLVLDMGLNDRMNYVIQSDFLQTDQTESYGVNQYLFYDINEWLALGGRGEWWKSDGVSYYEVTGGVNIKPTGNLVIRPEVRYQFSPSADDFSGISNSNNPAGLPVGEGAIFGIDAILTF